MTEKARTTAGITAQLFRRLFMAPSILPLIGVALAVAVVSFLSATGALPVTTPAGASTFSDTTADRVFGSPNFTSQGSAATATGLNSPVGLAFDATGRLFVGDQSNNRVLVFDNPANDTTADTVIGQANFTSSGSATTTTGMDNPNGLAFDATGRLFVVDANNHRVLVFDNPANDATADTVICQPNFTTNTSDSTAKKFNRPRGLAFDATGRLFVADQSNNRVLVFDNPSNDTTADTVIGQPNFITKTSGTTANKLNGPFGLAFDATGRLFVADGNNNRVLVFDNPANDTTADTIIGQPNFTSSGSATTATGINNPTGLAFDATGRLFVADRNNQRVLAFDKPANDATADTVIGQPGFTTSGSATTANAFTFPFDLAFDTTGRLFVSDFNNHRVLGFNADTVQTGSTSSTRDTAVPGVAVVTVTTGSATITTVAAATDSYVQVNISGGTTTTGDSATLKNASTAAGSSGSYATANYTETFSILNAGRDTVVMPIWTNQSSLRTFVGLRSDTGSMNGAALPTGIPNTDTGRNAFGATIILLEFSDSTGRLLGDTKSTTSIADSFSYSLRYLLSETTVAFYASLGFDTSAGSNSFRFWYADTYGAAWTLDTTVTIVVRAAAAPFKLEIVVSGITKDLPGGLGGVGSSAAGGGGNSNCIIQQLAPYASFFAALRSTRDFLLNCFLGRFLCMLYYAFSSLFGS